MASVIAVTCFVLTSCGMERQGTERWVISDEGPAAGQPV